MEQIVNHFYELLKQKEMAEGRDIPLTRVSAETGIARKTLISWRDEKGIERFDSKVVISLCNYFKITLDKLIEGK